jgi:hypothetical protein
MLAPHVLKGIKMGLIPIDRVVRWADQMILAADVPEMWLIDLATASADKHDVIGTMRRYGASTDVDDDTFLALVAYGFFYSQLTLEQVRDALYFRFCSIDWNEMTPLRRQIYIFDDEINWDAIRARRTCAAILEPFRDVGERLVTDDTNYLKRP